MSELERHYARLVRWFYPKGSRRAEIVGTYLDIAAPGQRRPALADITDLAAGGLRERVRAAGAVGLEAGVRLAGVLSLITLTALAAGWFGAELSPPYRSFFGPFLSVGVVAWASWLLVAAVHVLSPGRWTRHAIAAALLITAAVVPFAALTETYRPPAYVLLAQFTLGVVALAATAPTPIGAIPPSPTSPPTTTSPLTAALLGRAAPAQVWVRLLPLAAAAAIALTKLLPGVLVGQRADETLPLFDYLWGATLLLPATGFALLIGALLIAVGLAVRGDHRGGWTLLALAAPIGMLTLHSLAINVSGFATGSWNASYPFLAVTAAAVAVVTPALIPLALALRPRRPGPATSPAASPATHCASCGGPLP